MGDKNDGGPIEALYGKILSWMDACIWKTIIINSTKGGTTFAMFMEINNLYRRHTHTTENGPFFYLITPRTNLLVVFLASN